MSTEDSEIKLRNQGHKVVIFGRTHAGYTKYPTLNRRTEFPEFRVALTFAAFYPEARRQTRTAPAIQPPFPLPRQHYQELRRDAIASEPTLIHSREQWRLHRPANACLRHAGRVGLRRSRCANCRLCFSNTDTLEQCDGTYPICTPCQCKAIECSYGTSKRR